MNRLKLENKFLKSRNDTDKFILRISYTERKNM